MQKSYESFTESYVQYIQCKAEKSNTEWFVLLGTQEGEVYAKQRTFQLLRH